MLSLVRGFFGRKTVEASHAAPTVNQNQTPSSQVLVDGAPAFALSQHIRLHEGYPILDWQAVQAWIDELASPALRALAWAAIERGWLLHMRAALGAGFQLQESGTAMLLSSLEANIARATMDYMERTLGRVLKLLDGIAEIAPMGKDILIVFDDDESYYRYASYYYPEGGEFALSGGMHIDSGCSHYVTIRSDLRTIEPVIAHEMTHGFVGHLPLPLWLNEGLAVNVERRLTGERSTHTPQQLQVKHAAFWGVEEIQQFWSGESFTRTDDGNLLSYDLARLLVEHLGKDWQAFKSFVLSASAADAGALAAQEHLGVELGEFVCALLDRPPAEAWKPAAYMQNADVPASLLLRI